MTARKQTVRLAYDLADMTGPVHVEVTPGTERGKLRHPLEP